MAIPFGTLPCSQLEAGFLQREIGRFMKGQGDLFIVLGDVNNTGPVTGTSSPECWFTVEQKDRESLDDSPRLSFEAQVIIRKQAPTLFDQIQRWTPQQLNALARAHHYNDGSKDCPRCGFATILLPGMESPLPRVLEIQCPYCDRIEGLPVSAITPPAE